MLYLTLSLRLSVTMFEQDFNFCAPTPHSHAGLRESMASMPLCSRCCAPSKSSCWLPNEGKLHDAGYSTIFEEFQSPEQWLEILVQIFGFITLKGAAVGGEQHSSRSGVLTCFPRRALGGGDSATSLENTAARSQKSFSNFPSAPRWLSLANTEFNETSVLNVKHIEERITITNFCSAACFL